MLGLIYKDFAVLKRSLWFFGLWFLAFGLFCGYLSSVDFFCGALSVFCAVLPLTTLSYDSQCGWEGYALTLPVSRRALALSRYLLALIFTVASVIVNFILRFFLAQDGSIGATLTVVAAIGGAALVMIAFMLPLMCRKRTSLPDSHRAPCGEFILPDWGRIPAFQPLFFAPKSPVDRALGRCCLLYNFYDDFS